MSLINGDPKVVLRTMTLVARVLMEVAMDGAKSLTAARVRELKGIARGLARVRLRRLAARLAEFARQAGALLRHEQGGGDDLAMLLSDCVATAKLIKTQLKRGNGRPDVLDEVFEAKWREEHLGVLTNRLMVEMAVVSEPWERAGRLDSRYLMDSASGDVFVQRSALSWPQSEDVLPPRPRSGPLYVGRAQVIPSFAPREVRLQDATETAPRLDERTLGALLAAGHAGAAACAAAYARAHRNYFAPPVGYGLVAVHQLAAIGTDVHVMDAGGELLKIDRSGSPQGVRCVRLAERARLAGIFGRIFRDREGRLTIGPLATLAHLRGLELVRL